MRALGLGEGDEIETEADRDAAASVTEAPEAPDADLAAERRAILERLSRREIAADEAAAACVAGRELSAVAVFYRTQTIEHPIGEAGA